MDRNYQLIVHKIKKYLYNYKEFVKHNPLVATEVESALRWISYLTTGNSMIQ